MSKRKSNKDKLSKEIGKYDKYWQRENYISTKTEAGRKSAGGELNGKRNKDHFAGQIKPPARSTIGNVLLRLNFENFDVGQATIDRLLGHIKNCDASTGITNGDDCGIEFFKKYLARFLVLSPRQGWEKKFRPVSSDQVLNQKATHSIIAWVDAYFEKRRDILEKSLSPEEIENGSSEKKNRLKSGNGESHRCMVLKGKPGVGKTTCIEAICNSFCYTLESIDCCWFDSFSDLKKKYSEAVKTQSVGPSSKVTSQQPNSQLDSYFQKSPFQKDFTGNEGEQNKKKEDKIFLICNLEYFIESKSESDSEKLLKQVIEFSDFSRFPLVVEIGSQSLLLGAVKSSKNFDIVDYEEPDIILTSSLLNMLIHIENLNTFEEVRQLKRYPESELVEDLEMIGKEIQLYLGIIESCMENCGEKCPIESNKFTSNDAQLLIQSYNFNLHKTICNLSYHSSYSKNKWTDVERLEEDQLYGCNKVLDLSEGEMLRTLPQRIMMNASQGKVFEDKRIKENQVLRAKLAETGIFKIGDPELFDLLHTIHFSPTLKGERKETLIENFFYLKDKAYSQ